MVSSNFISINFWFLVCVCVREREGVREGELLLCFSSFFALSFLDKEERDGLLLCFNSFCSGFVLSFFF